MSDHREDKTDAPDATPYARCKKQPRDVYTSIWCGTQRRPEHPDEAGALCVVDCVFGGRIAIYAITGDSKYRRVQSLGPTRKGAA